MIPVRFLLAAAAVTLLLAPAAPALAQPAAAAQPAAVQVIDRGRFTVEVTGHGPDVILIPGLASSRAVYDGVAADLARDHRVHRVQIAGFAGLAAGPNATGAVVDPAIEELHRYIADQGLVRPAVIGHSLGGLSGLLLAQRHPGDVGRLMIVDAVPFFSALFDPNATAASVETYAGQMRATMAAMAPDAFAQGQQRTAATLVLTPGLRQTMVDWSLASDRAVMSQAMYEGMTTDARPGLAAMTTPVTVLYAWDASMGVPSAQLVAIYAGLYAGLPEVNLVRVEGSYHFIMWDQAERFAQEVGAFLE
jgi:pimeloyl-ACP methyl ester carboxylesterase